MDVDPVELAHWKAVAAKPFDEAPRWEYLKWLKVLSDESHRERAKFMALQMDAALCRPWDAVALESANYRSPHLLTWGPLSQRDRLPNSGFDVTRWEGGFPSRVKCASARATSVLANLTAVAPITGLDLEPLNFSYESPANEQTLRRLAEYERRANSSSYAKEAFERLQRRVELGALPPATQLRRWLDDQLACVLPLVSQSQFQQLRHFGLSAEEALLTRILERSELSNLTSISIDIQRTRDGDGPIAGGLNAYRSLFAMRSTPRLKALRVSGTAEEFGEAADAIGALPALERMGLPGGAGRPLERALTAASALRCLELTGPGWGDVVSSWQGLAELEEIVVIRGDMSDLIKLFSTNKLERLQSLRLDSLYNAVPDGFEIIFRSLNRLQRLAIQRTDFGDAALDRLTTSHAFRHLLALEISSAAITDEAVYRFARTARLPNLRWALFQPHSRTMTDQALYAVNRRWPVANAAAFE